MVSWFWTSPPIYPCVCVAMNAFYCSIGMNIFWRRSLKNKQIISVSEEKYICGDIGKNEFEYKVDLFCRSRWRTRERGRNLDGIINTRKSCNSAQYPTKFSPGQNQERTRYIIWGYQYTIDNVTKVISKCIISRLCLLYIYSILDKTIFQEPNQYQIGVLIIWIL